VIDRIDPRMLPAMAGNRLYLDYLAGTDRALRFYSHPPRGWGELDERRGHRYPRAAVAGCLAEYNRQLGAGARALSNIEALTDDGTLCVITGQQAGFLGGPAYTTYKIVTVIRLAAHLEQVLQARVVPVFWLASEDHDFYEINHAYFPKRDGEIGRVHFGWSERGRPVADLPVTERVQQAYDAFFEGFAPGPYWNEVKDRFAFQPGEGFAAWGARTWSQLFAEHGLIVVEPHVLRPAMADLFAFALEHVVEIERGLNQVAEQLRDQGYAPALTSERAGWLYTCDASGRRVRVEDIEAALSQVREHPERFSTDAALRPLFADAVLPVAASALGPGEIAYQAMLKPLYELFEVPQPVLFPRKNYTVLSSRHVERLDRYRVRVEALLTASLDKGAILNRLVPASDRQTFAAARQGLHESMASLRSHLLEVDPSLDRMWERTVSRLAQGLDKLESRTFKARTRQMGFCKGELQALSNLVLPRGRLQERVLPLPYLMNLYGPRFLSALFSAGELEDFSHHVLVLEEDGHA
jgi:bacillithiol biosynthesis cysteine-adding enzyme BshC